MEPGLSLVTSSGQNLVHRTATMLLLSCAPLEHLRLHCRRFWYEDAESASPEGDASAMDKATAVEEEVFWDNEPIISLNRYFFLKGMGIDCISAEDEKAVVERILADHLHSEE